MKHWVIDQSNFPIDPHWDHDPLTDMEIPQFHTKRD